MISKEIIFFISHLEIIRTLQTETGPHSPNIHATIVKICHTFFEEPFYVIGCWRLCTSDPEETLVSQT